MEELINKINWKSTKGVILISIVGLMILYFLFDSVPKENRYMIYLGLIFMIITIVYKLSPSQEIVIGEGSEIGGAVEQISTSEKIGKQKITVNDKTKTGKGVSQK